MNISHIHILFVKQYLRTCLWNTVPAEELGLSVHSDNGELVVVTLTGEREVQVGTKQAAGKMKAGYWRRCRSYSVVATDWLCVLSPKS